MGSVSIGQLWIASAEPALPRNQIPYRPRQTSRLSKASFHHVAPIHEGRRISRACPASRKLRRRATGGYRQRGAPRLDGVGTLKIVLHAPATTHVTSVGRVDSDGVLALDQHIEQQGKPARDRQWRIRPLGNGRYTGTLTDASGPVTGETEGNRLHLHFPMKGGMRVDQWLTLSADGQVAQNHLIVRKLGVTVAILDETIRKIT